MSVDQFNIIYMGIARSFQIAAASLWLLLLLVWGRKGEADTHCMRMHECACAPLQRESTTARLHPQF